MYVLGLFVVFSGIVLLLRRRKTDFVLRKNCDNVLAKLRSNRSEDILEFVQDDARRRVQELAGMDFYQKLGGLRGLRLQNIEMGYILRALEDCVSLGLVPSGSAKKVWLLSVGAALHSLLAVPGHYVCKITGRNNYVNALMATQYHWEATLLTLKLCQVDGAPPCFLNPDALL